MRIRVVVEYDVVGSTANQSYAKVKAKVKELVELWPNTFKAVFLSVEQVTDGSVKSTVPLPLDLYHSTFCRWLKRRHGLELKYNVSRKAAEHYHPTGMAPLSAADDYARVNRL